MSLKTRLRKTLVITLVAAACGWAWYRWSPGNQWQHATPFELRTLVLDYTVPFATYKEHLGLIWLLNHRKVRPPGDAVQWEADRHYLGYLPRDRRHPQRLAQADLDGIDLVYIADTYGVYRDDVRHADLQQAHMDYNPLVFGGLNAADAEALNRHLGRGGMLIAEFNTICDPTASTVRAWVERLLDLHWTGWVARLFLNPRDTNDVPHWFPREFRKQFPNHALPTAPTLLLIDRSGRMLVFSDKQLEAIAPRVVMTDLGREDFPDAPADAPYYYWFALMQPGQQARVYARMKMPDLPQLNQLLEELKVSVMPPVMIEGPNEAPQGRRLYFAGDFSDIDFEPGDYASRGRIFRQGLLAAKLAGVTSAPVFWRFYAPVMHQLLEDAARAVGGI